MNKKLINYSGKSGNPKPKDNNSSSALRGFEKSLLKLNQMDSSEKVNKIISEVNFKIEKENDRIAKLKIKYNRI